MNKERVTLLYLGSKAIENYIARHPVSWANAELAKRGGIGDRAGMPPTPMVYEFFSLVAQKQGLFTQSEYRDHCFEQWCSWNKLENQDMREGVAAKLYRNVYPSMVNTLHAWSLLVEARWFDLCVIDTATDALSKHDLIVSRSGCTPIALDLFIQTERAVNDRQYKLSHRKASRDFVCESFDVPLPIHDRQKRQPGNMRWYCLKDFAHVYVKYQEEDGADSNIPCTCGCHISKEIPRHRGGLPTGGYLKQMEASR